LSANIDNCKDCHLKAFCNKCLIHLIKGSRLLATISRPCCDCVQQCEAVRKIEGE
jgi:hypothetical protein